MAVNQVSLSFYPPRWRPRVIVKPLASGQRVYVAESVSIQGAQGSPVLAGELRNWLVAQGFLPAVWGGETVFERGQVRSIFGVEKEIEVSLGEEVGEVTDLYCRFTLPRPGRPPLAAWAEFAASLCRRFGMRLGADDAGPCTEPVFLAAIQNCPNYREFAAGE